MTQNSLQNVCGSALSSFDGARTDGEAMAGCTSESSSDQKGWRFPLYLEKWKCQCQHKNVALNMWKTIQLLNASARFKPELSRGSEEVL